MNIEKFNSTLSWLDEAVVSKFDDNDYDLVIEVNSTGGGPGENVTGYMAFNGVCYLALPMVMSFSDCPKVSICDLDSSLQLIPDYLKPSFEEEIKDGLLKVIQLSDGQKELSYFIVCYGYDFYQDPIDWFYE